MSKFAVGDLIRAIPGCPYSETNENAVCKVLRNVGNGMINVEIVNSWEPMLIGNRWSVNETWFYKIRPSQKEFMEECNYV